MSNSLKYAAIRDYFRHPRLFPPSAGFAAIRGCHIRYPRLLLSFAVIFAICGYFRHPIVLDNLNGVDFLRIRHCNAI